MKTLPSGRTRALSLLLGLVTAILFSSPLMAVDCTSASIQLHTQAEIDDFQATYGGGGICTSVSNLEIEGADIVDLTPLSALTDVTFLLGIVAPALTNLDGLSNITSVGTLNISRNDSLTNVDGLSALTSVGLLVISDNDSLTNIDGLSGITSVGDDVGITENAVLTNIDGLSNLTSLGWDVRIQSNPLLVDLNGLSGLTSVSGVLSIVLNDSLINVDGLSAMTIIGDDIRIRANDALVDLSGLAALTSTGETLLIESNHSMTNLKGLSALTSVGGSFIIVDSILSSLDGLSELISVGVNVQLWDNPSLSDCSALTTLLNDVDDGAPGPGPGLAGIPDVGGDLIIFNNIPNCNSIDEILADSAAQEPPTADFSSSCTNLVCSFTDQSSDSDGTIASWAWDFDDGAMSSMENPGHTYASAGTYSVGLTVTDNDGDSDSTSKNVTVTDPFVINAAMSDAWFFPATSGQGFFIIVWEDLKMIFLAWFTYDTERPPVDITAIFGEPGHRWVTALGPYDGDTALLEVFLSSGMILDSGDPPVDTVTLEGATIEIIWTGCNEGIIKYDFPSLGLSGEIPIERITLDNVPACEAAQAQ